MKLHTRDLITILLAGLWVNANEFVRNQILLNGEWVKHFQSLGQVFPAAPINALVWVVWGFVFVAIVFALAQKFTLAQTFGLAWVIGFVMMWLVIWNLNVLPMGILPAAIPLSLIETFGAAYICKHANFAELKRELYLNNKPSPTAKVLNRGWAILHAMGIAPNRYVTLEVRGRKSGKIISFPLVMVSANNTRYLVSMLGAKAEWVRNVQAAGGKAVMRHGKTENVVLEEIQVEQRASIIKAYLQVAPGARPHIPVDKDATLSEFEKIVPDYPVFRIDPNTSA
jgi:deazaflavin-dependent oxidoreductase (nitroreductase family)